MMWILQNPHLIRQ